MDVREKLVEQAISHFWYGISHDIFSEPVTTYAKLAIEALEKEKESGVTLQDWISVEDRLPENSTYVNVTTDGVVAQAYWHNGKFFAFTVIGVATVGGVTHWMPLPEPPDMRGET